MRTLPLALAFAALGLVGACGRPLEAPPYAGNLEDVLAGNPLAPGEKVKVTVLQKTKDATVQIIQLRVPIKTHYHKHSDETVYLIRGQGMMMVGGRRYEAGPGSLYHVPRRTVHAFAPQEGSVAVALSVFTPPFRQGDRTFEP